MEKKQTKVPSKYLERPAVVCNTIATFVSVSVMWKSGFGLLQHKQWMHRDFWCTKQNESTFTDHKAPATSDHQEQQREGVCDAAESLKEKRKTTFAYTCVCVCVVYTSIIYNMRVMWSNHGKETARHRIRVLSSSPAYWPNGVALKNPNKGKE